MSYYDSNHRTPYGRFDLPAAADAGLRAHMLRVYNYMAGGLAVTGLAAYAAAASINRAPARRRSGSSCWRPSPSRVDDVMNHLSSMIAFALAQLSAEDPVDENHVTENDRQQHQRSHQHEDLRRRRGRRLPYRQRRWNEIGEIRDQKPEIAQQEQRDGREEREDLASALEPPPKRECNERGRGRHPPVTKK